jgi:hypothetical protein
MRVNAGLMMLASYFCHSFPAYHNFSLIKENLLLVLTNTAPTTLSAFSSGVDVKFAQSAEMSQTLLTNKKQGNLD